ncbi:probable glutamate receptor [Homarus americanus]|uniref:probable glutamate receptor n=1 Tax=Homarus americanus TaxID=6706 RepID=UPI001C45F93E|nr:probable glutamate receptor [Homarus americanus]
MTAASPQPLKIAVGTWGPWAIVSRREDGAIVVEGTMRRILEMFTQAMNLDYQLVLAPDGKWGNLNTSGYWSGLMGLIQRKEVEIALGPFIVTSEREELCDFSLPLYIENSAIVYQRPALESDIMGFLKPFSLTVWVLLLLSAMSVGLVLVWALWVEGKIFPSTFTRNKVSKAAICVFKSITQESSSWVPAGNGSRGVVATWFMASLVFFTSYGSTLTSLLTVPRVNVPIDSVADLVAQDTIRWGLAPGYMWYQYFRDSEDDVRRQVFERTALVPTGCYRSRSQVIYGDLARFCDVTTILKIMSLDFSMNGKCHLYMAKETVHSNFPVSVAFQKNSPHLPRANKILIQLQESGILGKWRSEHINNATQCLRHPSKDRPPGLYPLTLHDLSGPFLLLAVGVMSALVCFLGETLGFRFWQD